MKLPIRIELPEGFLGEEVRCGYTVSEKQKKVWAIELDLLAEFDRVCKKHSIRYQIFAGTLLGAVRHSGFIPWDDDIDVCLLREDYDRLIKNRDEFRHPYFLQTPDNDKRFFSVHTRLRNSETTGIIKGQADESYNNGIFMDVFVMDVYVSSGICRSIQKFFLKILTGLLTSRYMRLGSITGLATRILRVVAKVVSSIVPFRLLLRLRDGVCMMNKFKCGEKRVSLVSNNNSFTEKYWLYSDEMLDSMEFPFENISVWGPRFYNSILGRIYGDYMQFPPMADRGKWHLGKIVFDPEVPYVRYIREHKEGL